MKKLSFLFALLSCFIFASCNETKTVTKLDLTKFEDIVLLPPDMENKTPLMEALQNRKTSRDFTEKELTLEDLSNVLWAAYGINRTEGGKRTVPSAMAQYPVEVYAVLSNGIYLYNAETSTLQAKVEGDFRELTGGQEFVFKAPLNIVYIADFNKYAKFSTAPENKLMNFAMADASHSSQNVYLYCAVANMKTVIRGGGVSETELLNLLGLDDKYKVLLAQTIGY